MDIKKPQFVIALNQMRNSRAKVPSTFISGITRTQSDLALKLNRYTKKLSAYEDNYGLLKVLGDTLKCAKDECASKEKLMNFVRNELISTQELLKEYSEYIRKAKYRRWMVGSVVSLLGQMFMHMDDISGCLEYPVFSTCRDAWFRLREDTVLYSVLAKAYGKLVSPTNDTEANVIHERSVETFRSNVPIFRRVHNELEVEYRIHGRALVSFGVSKGGVPLLLSLDCNFDMDGNIDGLDRKTVGYDIIAFRPIEEKVIRKVERVARADALKMES
jgi:hypothetical protein